MGRRSLGIEAGVWGRLIVTTVVGRGSGTWTGIST